MVGSINGQVNNFNGRGYDSQSFVIQVVINYDNERGRSILIMGVVFAGCKAQQDGVVQSSVS